ncbi:hypothetical protein JAAARDRAFT_117660, partial [Jaapia argillacea MUCL 33604]
MQAFIHKVLYPDNGQKPGLFGKCTGYYGTVEAQGRGTLHCHFLIWLEGNPNPQKLRDKMLSSVAYKEKIFTWLESIIKCELPGQTIPIYELDGQPMKPPIRKPDELPATLREPPHIADFSTRDEFYKAYQEHVHDLVVECNWHKHKQTCWKNLQPGQPHDDSTCCMRMNGCIQEKTELDSETYSILLRCLHPRINNHNDLLVFLLACNIDIKYIGSGEAAKALVYYVTDYITKNNLSAHVGLKALAYAIKQNDNKYAGMEVDNLVEEKSLFVKAVNSMMASQEVSHQQVMSYLVGGGDYYCSHKFQILPWYAFQRYIS